MKALISKRVLVLGGSGYLGSKILTLAAQAQASTVGLSRRGPLKGMHQHQWVLADVCQVDKYADAVARADLIVHSVGVLFDKTVGNKSVKPGDPGTYQQINRDSLIGVVNEAAKHGGKTIVYISGEGHPPFLPRYQITKREAQLYLLSEPRVKGVVLKPGVIYSWSDKFVTGPLAIGVGIWGKIQPRISALTPQGGHARSLVDQFKVAEPIRLEAVARAALAAGMKPECHGRVLGNAQIEAESEGF